MQFYTLKPDLHWHFTANMLICISSNEAIASSEIADMRMSFLDPREEGNVLLAQKVHRLHFKHIDIIRGLLDYLFVDLFSPLTWWYESSVITNCEKSEPFEGRWRHRTRSNVVSWSHRNWTPKKFVCWSSWVPAAPFVSSKIIIVAPNTAIFHNCQIWKRPSQANNRPTFASWRDSVREILAPASFLLKVTRSCRRANEVKLCRSSPFNVWTYREPN